MPNEKSRLLAEIAALQRQTDLDLKMKLTRIQALRDRANDLLAKAQALKEKYRPPRR